MSNVPLSARISLLLGLMLLVVCAPAETAAQPPVAYYPFDGNAQDVSGNGLHGYAVGAELVSDRFGRPDGAYRFVAEERDFIGVAHNDLLAFGTHDFTVVAWVLFCNAQQEYAGIVCKGPPNNSYPGYQLHIGSYNRFTTQIGDQGKWCDEQRAPLPLDDGRWHMVAVVVSPATNTVVQHIDGREVTNAGQVYNRRGPLDVSRYDPTTLYIGTERNSDRFFDGDIDDVALFDRVLGPRELQALYNRGGWDDGGGDYVAYYPFNGDASDESGNGHDGTVRGARLTFDRFGNPNSAYAFSAADKDHIAIPHSPALSFGKHDFTVVAWVKFCREQTEYAGIVCKGPPDNSYPGYQLHVTDGHLFTTQIGDEGNWSDEQRGVRFLDDGCWHMVAVVVSPENNTVDHFIDGSRVMRTTQHYTRRGPLNVSRYDPTTLYIGTERNFDRFFDGLIDDVRLYNRALGECEMRGLYHENGWTTCSSMLPEPRINMNGPAELCPGERRVLWIAGYPDVRWSAGESGNRILRIDRPGTYSATVSDGSGCEEKTVSVVIGSNCDDLFGAEGGVSGITEETGGILVGTVVKLYPNPTRSRSTLTFTLSGRNNVSLEVFDVLGRVVDHREPMDLEAGNHRVELETGHLPGGLYLLRLHCNQESRSVRLVVEK